MERHFVEELKNLNEKILKIASLVENSIYQAVDSLKNKNEEQARRVVSDDKRIDELELEIDNYALELLSRYQPQASDLRFVTNAMKINAELERIADLSVDIAQRVLDLMGQPLLKQLIDIPRLAELSQKMVKDAINSFLNRDVEMAKRVILSDQEGDNLRNAIQRELIYDYIVKDGASAPRAIPLLLVARHLERICDHATNIAEDVVYMVKAEVVKHHPERL